MNLFKNKKYLIWALLFLLLVNISAMATMVYHVYFQGDKKPAVSEMEIPDSRMGRFFKTELDLDLNQTDAIRKYHQAYYPEANQISFQLQDLRAEMLNELKVESPDSLKLIQISEEIGSRHADLKKLTCKYYLNLKKNCNVSQKDKLAKVFQDLMNAEESDQKRNDGRGPQRRNRGQFKGSRE